MAILGRRTRTQFLADLDGRHIAHAHWNAVALCDDDVAKVFQRLCLSGHPHQQLRAIALDETGTAIAVVTLDGAEYVAAVEPIGQQFGRIGRDQNFLLEAPNRIHLHHTGYAQQLGSNDPVVYGAQIGRRDWSSIAVDGAGFGIHGEHEYLPQPRSNRAQYGFESRRQVAPGRCDALAYLLACEVDVRAFLEHCRDLREAIA